MKQTRRDYDSFKWIKLTYFRIMLGFGISSDWRSLKPWTVDGDRRRYFDFRKEGKSDKINWNAVYAGPLVIHMVKYNG